MDYPLNAWAKVSKILSYLAYVTIYQYLTLPTPPMTEFFSWLSSITIHHDDPIVDSSIFHSFSLSALIFIFEFLICADGESEIGGVRGKPLRLWQ